MTDDRLGIQYTAQGGYARTDARLTVDEAGDAQMFLGSTMSLPPGGELDRVGIFEGRLEPALRKRLLAQLAHLPEDLPPAPPPVPDSVIRNLTVTVNERSRAFSIPGTAPPPLDEIERLLQKVMTGLLGQPAETLGVTLDIDSEGAPALVLSSVGTRPITLRFTRDDGTVTARGTVAMMSPQGEVYGSESLSPEVIPDLMASGAISAGPAPLAPGHDIRLPFAAPETPPTKGRVVLTGGIELDMDAGGQTRHLSVRAREVTRRR